MQKSLVYFTTALKNNERVIEKLSRFKKFPGFENFIQYNEEIEDLMEDVIIENKQAIEMVEMHRNILEGMMDAFASIISNNLNMVMKFLTSITIILAIPTMVASFWGMNVAVPLADVQNAFLYILIFALILSGIIAAILVKKGLF
jgi:magnesium transporter